jgi:CheY-like chemotaxis protein
MGYAHAAAPAEILLVEDNADYAYLTQRAFGKANLSANLHHVDNGKKCLDFLRQQPPYGDAPVPDIVLLDLEMPGMDGRQVLTEIVNDESLRHLAVVVLTSRDDPTDILRMYQLRCSSYICKPADYDKYVDMIGKFANYWLSVVMLPTKGTGSSGWRAPIAPEPVTALCRITDG